MRNRLINFRPGKRSVLVVDEISTEIYDLLVLQEKTMQFLPKPEEEKDENEDIEEDNREEKEDLEDSSLTKEEADILWELPEPDLDVTDRHKDLFLQTNIPSKDLQRRLRTIHQQSNSVFEEQGYNILYLALGLLEWTQSPDELKSHKAPLILIPVTLARKKVGSPFKLSWTGEDIITNISLKAKLEEQDINLPDFEMPEDKEDIFKYFQTVKESISKMSEWNVLNDIYLSFFSFTKFVMFQDLDPKNWPKSHTFDKNPIINDLFSPDEGEEFESFHEGDVDRKLKSSDSYNVLDADSSQIAVIEDAKAGRNLVVEGPPGTGKSQTIVNLIAELMATGKTVLFVSEKMAALEVVKNRLDHIGLGEFCLELHSHKSNKKEVLNQLQKTLKEPAESPIYLDGKFNEIEQLKQDLNHYPEIIHKPIGKVEFTPFQLFGIKESALLHFGKKDKIMPSYIMDNVANVSFDEWNDSINKLDNIQQNLEQLPPLSEHPWRFSSPDIILPSDENIITTLLNESVEKIKDLQAQIDILIELTGIKLPLNSNELTEAFNLAEYVANADKVEKEVLNNSDWDGVNVTAIRIINILKDIKRKTESYQADVLDKNLIQLRDNFIQLSNKRLKFLSGEYKTAKTEIQSLYLNTAPNDEESLLTNLSNLIEWQETLKDIKRKTESYQADVLDKNLIQLRDNFIQLSNKRLKFLSGEYKTAKTEVQSLYLDFPPNDDESLLSNLNNLIEWQETLKDIKRKTESYQADVLDKNLTQLRDNFINQYNIYMEFLNGDYKKAKTEIQTLYLNTAPNDEESLLTNLNNLIEWQETRNKLDLPKYKAIKSFGSKWKGTETNYNELIEFSDWIKDFKAKLNEGIITDNTVDIISSRPNKDSILKQVNTIINSHKELKSNIKELQTFLHIDFTLLFEKNDFSYINFENLLAKMELLSNEVPQLFSWSQYLTLKKDLPELTEQVIKLVEDSTIEPDDLIPCFKGNFADSILRNVFNTNSSLAGFVGRVHENKIRKFRNLDKELLLLNRKRVKHSISSKRPPINKRVSPNSELGILLGEFNRKRRHMPIRKLLAVAGGLIQRIKPCFMMSPLSVAQFIDPENVENLMFDVIIFDEASQVKPEDALGAFLRGKKLIVMGDTKQLPPTSFFDSMADAEDEEDYEISTLKDMESILHLCKRSFPTKMLRWHYRSKHESLIAVSNHLFYDNQLLIYPSPSNNTERLGLRFINQPESYYDRGRSSGNMLEAKCVVQKVIEHYKKYQNKKTLGIGTFNQNQRRLIEDYLEIELKNNPGIEEYLSGNEHEKFFVKNLETIQGDERDVIFVSVGFGFDSNKKLYQNFGPINKDGGERRLNVLFTRAREKCVIFSNFKYSDLKIGENSPFGLRALKSFLEFAETRQLIAYEPPRSDSDSPFEDSVYEFLKDQGFEVHKQVGCAGFRIDLALVNTEAQGEYLIGIECDGATYHSSPVARDRDRLRQEVLEGLGWKIHRVWSTDWFRNRDETARHLLTVIEESKIREIPTIEQEIEEVLEIEEDSETIEELVDHDDQIFEPVQVISLENSIEPYQTCSGLQIKTEGDLQKISPQQLTPAILSVVYDESPIHLEEVTKRIRTFWGLKKSGRIIRDLIKSSAEIASSYNQITIKDDFLYKPDKEIVVRRRTETPNIDFICTEEIVCAIKLIIETQLATPAEDLIPQTARLFGFKATRKKVFERIKKVLNELIENGELIEMPNGMINFPKE